MELKTRTNQPVDGDIKDEVITIVQDGIKDGEVLGVGALVLGEQDLGDAQDTETNVVLPTESVGQPSDIQVANVKQALINAVKKGYIYANGMYLSLLYADLTSLNDEQIYISALFGGVGSHLSIGATYEILFNIIGDASDAINVNYGEV